MSKYMRSDMPIGFSNIVKYEWLEYAAKICVEIGETSAPEVEGKSEQVPGSTLPHKGQMELFHDEDTQCSTVNPVSNGKNKKEFRIKEKEQVFIRKALKEYISHELSVTVEEDSDYRKKIVTTLSRIWSSVPTDMVDLRDDALALYEEVADSERLVLHWGMTSAVYPFVFLVAETVGRLLRFQETFTLSQVRERVESVLGERPTVYHAVPKVIYSFVDWGALRRTSESKGVYAGTEPLPVKNETLIAWLLEAVLYAKGVTSLPVFTAVSSPGLFPFSIDPGVVTDYVIRQNSRLTTFRHGMNEDMVGLADK